MMKNLQSIVVDAQNEGFDIDCIDNNTIKTKKGNVNVVLNEGTGQPTAYLFKNEIQIYQNNKNIVDDLMHEKGHFDIFPYDMISYGVLYGSAITYSLLKVSDDWRKVAMVAVLETIMLWPIQNLYSDAILYVRNKIGLNKK